MYTALQQGVVQAMEGTPETGYTYKIFEVAKNCLETHHIYTDVSVVINKQFLANLPEDLQQLIRESSKTMAQFQRKMTLDTIESYKDMLRKENVVYSQIDTAQARAAVAGFHKSYVTTDPNLQMLYDMIINNQYK
jgi:TRAP-type C4-dicarboxylate transport system substrate-binding protein